MTLKMYYLGNLICSLLLLTFAPNLTLQNNVAVKPSPSPQIVAAEGGIILSNTKSEDKHVVEKFNKTLTSATPKILNNTQSVNVTDNGIKISPADNKFKSTMKPVTEEAIDLGIPKKNDETQSVGKKGVSFVDNDSNVNESLRNSTLVVKTNITPIIAKPTTSVPVPKKPSITEHDDFVSSDVEESIKLEPNPKIPSIDTLTKKSKSSDYVIPIVAVILSVPLVAIIISVLYKRGTDWWVHRNYRRMDFLIEGMYNN